MAFLAAALDHKVETGTPLVLPMSVVEVVRSSLISCSNNFDDQLSCFNSAIDLIAFSYFVNAITSVLVTQHIKDFRS
ncbi:hypothetical protein D3C72_2455300 [compost metagenome]